MRYYLIIITCIFCLLSSLLFSQESITQKEDSITVANLIKLGKENIRTDIESAKKYFHEAERISSKIGYLKGLQQSFFLQGKVYAELGISDSAFYYFNSSLFINRRIDHKLGITKCLIELALYSQRTGDYAEAIRNYFRSLDIMHTHPDTLTLGIIYHNLGSLYLELDKNRDALNYTLKAYDIEKEYKDSVLIGKSLYNLGQIYFNLDSLNRSQHFFNLSFDFNAQINNPENIAQTHLGYGRLLDKEQEFESAIENYNKAIQHFQTLQLKKQLAKVYFHFGKHYLNLKQLQKAHDLFNRALEINSQFPDLYLRQDILKELQELNTALKNFEEALTNSDELKRIEDQLKIPETLQYLAINEAELNFKLKEEKLRLEHQKELSRQKTVKLIFIGSSVFAIVVIILILFILREKNKHNQLLKKANDTRDKMFRLIAHDFRSPLISISNTVRLIPYKIKAKNYDSVTDLCENVTQSVNRVLGLIDNLINWALSQHDNIPYNPEKYNLKELSSDIIEIYKNVAEFKRIELVDSIDDHLEIYADKNILNTIFRNLINNAIKFTPEGGEVQIDAKPKDEIIEISIQDTGIGISKENLKKIFDVDKEKGEGTKGEQGNGLGLFFCKEFVHKNKGEIWVESELDKGSIFYFTVPTNVQ